MDKAMSPQSQWMGQQMVLRIGAVCAILGSIFSVAAGTGFDNLTNEYGTQAVLNSLAFRPEWSWPLVYLGFIFGALLWVGAFIVLADSLTGNLSRTLARMGVASVVLGTSIHVVDASISGFGLAALARAWGTASASEQANLLLAGDTLLWVLGGTWASVLSLFHGVPFVLLGLALVFSRAYPGWLGWIGVVGGAGSLAAGVSMFLGTAIFPERLFIAFAVLVSLWMVAIGYLMWRKTSVSDLLEEQRYQGEGVAS